jgi:hypothetical protein
MFHFFLNGRDEFAYSLDPYLPTTDGIAFLSIYKQLLDR